MRVSGFIPIPDPKINRVPIAQSSIALLEALSEYTHDAEKDLHLPVRIQKNGEEQSYRPPDVYLMRLTDSKSAQKKAPYILHQLVTFRNQQERGEDLESFALVRSIFCAYCDDEQEGSLYLLNMMERFRIPLLANPLIGKGGQFELNLQEGLESLIYPDDTAPYFVGETMTTWRIPPVKREVPQIW